MWKRKRKTKKVISLKQKFSEGQWVSESEPSNSLDHTSCIHPDCRMRSQQWPAAHADCHVTFIKDIEVDPQDQEGPAAKARESHLGIAAFYIKILNGASLEWVNTPAPIRFQPFFTSKHHSLTPTHTLRLKFFNQIWSSVEMTLRYNLSVSDTA